MQRVPAGLLDQDQDEQDNEFSSHTARLHRALTTAYGHGSRALQVSRPYAATTIFRTVDALNALSVPAALVAIMSAFPDDFIKLNGKFYSFGLGLCMGELVLDVAASRAGEIEIRGKKIKLETLHRIVESSITGANTFYFTYIATAAVFIAIYAEINDIGEREIDVSNLFYILVFLLPNSLIGTCHALINLTRETWAHSRTLLSQMINWLNELLTLLCNSSTMYTLFFPLLTVLGLSQSGDINPYERLAIAGGALYLGLLTMIVRHRNAGHSEVLNRTMDVVSMAAYLSVIFNADSRAEMGESNTAAMKYGIIAISICALLTSIIWPARSAARSEINRVPVDTAAYQRNPRETLFYHDADGAREASPAIPISPTSLRRAPIGESI